MYLEGFGPWLSWFLSPRKKYGFPWPCALPMAVVVGYFECFVGFGLGLELRSQCYEGSLSLNYAPRVFLASATSALHLPPLPEPPTRDLTYTRSVRKSTSPCSTVAFVSYGVVLVRVRARVRIFAGDPISCIMSQGHTWLRLQG